MYTKKVKRLVSRLYKDSRAKAQPWACDWLAEKAQIAARVRECAEDGQIATVQSGMDCDCVRYSGWVSYIPATVTHFLRAQEHMYKWADGPCSMRIERPSIARRIERTSRDLAMEAYEDGHAHVVYDTAQLDDEV